MAVGVREPSPSRACTSQFGPCAKTLDHLAELDRSGTTVNDSTFLSRRTAAFRGRALPTLLATFVAALLLLTLGASSARADTPGAPSEDPHPAPFTWTNGEVRLQFAGETPTFWVSSVQDGRVNFSASAVGLAEVAPSGEVVAYAPLGDGDPGWNLSWSTTSSGVLVQLTGTPSASPATGTWNTSEPLDYVYGNSTPIDVALTFHLSNSGGSSDWRVKFDVQASGWPWQDPSDSLGLVLGARAAQATNLTSGSSGEDVEESGGGSGSPIASLTWGPTASVSYPGGAGASVSVVSSVQGSSDDQSSSVDLLFVGAPGGYASLSYDPTVALSTLHFPRALVPAWVLSPPVLGTIAAAALLAVVLGTVAVRARATPSKDALASSSVKMGRGGARPAFPACRRCGSSLIPSALTGVRVLSCPRCST
ncbi:MAG: hypothetical protein KGJ23_00290 [Euryarchaeota archaeon]|nr:hypothetical protein [Euryarchaeota archaeon]MDE1835034.1 hypothetical protein [Euryarchaeota archaeon]MDE1882194.1 hypothetical protein [Euryarchaeota archaeon]MDE2044873.1 hypothetical protein [Thermoplasmata archaeon]